MIDAQPVYNNTQMGRKRYNNIMSLYIHYRL